MRFLTYVHDETEVARLRALFNDKGIPVLIQSARAPNMHALPRWAVHVCLPSQAADAARLLDDPEHVPAVHVDVETFNGSAYSSGLDTILGWSLVALVAVAAFFALAVALATH